MTPSQRSVFVELNGPGQGDAGRLSSNRNSAPHIRGWMQSIRSLHPKTSETHRPSHRFVPVIRQHRQENGIQSP
jgi:hypothetical protein